LSFALMTCLQPIRDRYAGPQKAGRNVVARMFFMRSYLQRRRHGPVLRCLMGKFSTMQMTIPIVARPRLAIKPGRYVWPGEQVRYAA
jgi:hypothetical protein